MKYKGRIFVVTVVLVLILIIRGYGILYYNYPPFKFPFLGLIILLVFWWLGKQYDMVKFLSEKDTVTNIYNRRYVIHTFPKLSVLMDRKNEKLMLFLIDVNNFKMINDNFGHVTGDKVLLHLSNLLLINRSESDIVARFGGDEFIIIAPFADKKDKDITIKQINKELRKSSEELNIDISVSIGTSLYPNDAKTLDGLLNIADKNMYKQKSVKKKNIKEDSYKLFFLRRNI
jgi:diguanylate cyclase (GGDEF)-like protein